LYVHTLHGTVVISLSKIWDHHGKNVTDKENNTQQLYGPLKNFTNSITGSQIIRAG
jgi:hypothetical protein